MDSELHTHTNDCTFQAHRMIQQFWNIFNSQLCTNVLIGISTVLPGGRGVNWYLSVTFWLNKCQTMKKTDTPTWGHVAPWVISHFLVVKSNRGKCFKFEIQNRLERNFVHFNIRSYTHACTHNCDYEASATDHLYSVGCREFMSNFDGTFQFLCKPVALHAKNTPWTRGCER